MNQKATPRRSLITKLSSASAKFWKITVALWVLVVGVGVFAYTVGLDREGFPPIEVPIAVVQGTYFVDDPGVVDAQLAQPLSEVLLEIDEVATVDAQSFANNVVLVVEFDQGTGTTAGGALLQSAIDRAGMPAEATLEVQPVAAGKFLEVYDVLATVTGPDDATAQQLEAEAAKLATALASAPGVERAEGRALLTEAVNPDSGETEVRQTRFSRAAFDGTDGFEQAITVGIVRSPNSELDILEFSDGINAVIDDQQVLSDGYQTAVTADFAKDVRTQVNSLISNLLTGLIAVAAVSLLLIGWRVAIVTAVFMATVTIAALAALWILGYTLNTITLFGLILTLGLLVDDAVVISESTDANRGDPMDGFDDPALGVVNSAVQRVGVASLAGTLTTVLVFAPLMFIGGILGEFIIAIPVTVITTLLVSYLFSVVFIPAVAKPFLLRSKPGYGPVSRAIRKIAHGAGRLAEYPSNHGMPGVAVGVGLIAFAFGTLIAAGGVAGTLGFNIFPSGDDANALFVEGDFAPNTPIEQAQATAREVDVVLEAVLGDDLVTAQYIYGNSQNLSIYVELTAFGDREIKAPEFIADINARLVDIDGIRVAARALEAGPPVEEYPFAVQIPVGDRDSAKLDRLAKELQDSLNGAELVKAGGDPTVIEESVISTEGFVYRVNGERVIEVRANYLTDDLTNNLTATEDYIANNFPDEKLAEYGLTTAELSFDYGLESDNQEDFAALGPALGIALLLMFVLLLLQFRSIVQPLLIFLAIPFSFLGVTLALKFSDNPISFFAAVGFIALLGVVVNNSILLVDAANQARNVGKRPGAAIGEAVERRFRPLVATTLTTVVGLLPLALSDPFWESLAFTLIGGLLSSTLIVIVSFPVFYLAVEKVRTPVRNWGRRRLGWNEIQ